ncbi:MAG: hypothetical protein FD138_4255, partial [Planctomycetota bacterium]
GIQPTRCHQIFDLVHDLQIDRHAVVGRNVDLHGIVSAQAIRVWLANLY